MSSPPRVVAPKFGAKWHYAPAKEGIKWAFDVYCTKNLLVIIMVLSQCRYNSVVHIFGIIVILLTSAKKNNHSFPTKTVHCLKGPKLKPKGVVSSICLSPQSSVSTRLFVKKSSHQYQLYNRPTILSHREPTNKRNLEPTLTPPRRHNTTIARPLGRARADAFPASQNKARLWRTPRKNRARGHRLPLHREPSARI